MIDQALVDNNVTHCLTRLTQKQATSIENVFKLDNFFTTDLVNKLLEYVKLENNWGKVELQDNTNRVSITWDPDTVFEETFMVLDQLTPAVNDQFNTNYKFTGLQLWKDFPGYQIGKHIDNSRVGYSIQIYLTEGIDQLGTHFYKDNNIVEIPYKTNVGYLTNSAQTVLHGMIKTVPEDYVRYSIYGIWA